METLNTRPSLSIRLRDADGGDEAYAVAWAEFVRIYAPTCFAGAAARTAGE